MSDLTTKKDLKLDENTDNVIPFRKATDGNGSSQGNWLDTMEIGTVFVCRPQQFKGPNLVECHLINNKDRSALLKTVLSPGEKLYHWEEKQMFCQMHELIEIVRLPNGNGS